MSADKQTRRKNRKPRSDLQRLSSRFMNGLLRSLFLVHAPARSGQAGFVLPTTVLLILVLTLTVGAMSFRTFSRSSSVIAQREQQVIDSAAAPVIDRAKAKLEYLFSRDTRFPGGVPASDVIASMMLNGGSGIPTLINDPYLFPGETRLDLDRDGTPDNAWLFETDVDGDGTTAPDEVVVYSILMDDANDPGTGIVSLTSSDDAAKARALVTRNGPINTAEALSGCGAFRAPEEGWQGLDSSTLQKNFQVTAFVANRNNVNRTASTLEFQQVRQADKGNKWGAWFKYDIEVNPGASRDFFWNGAMHTEGSLLANEKFVARMISSHNSCLYTQDASEITLAESENQDFQGQLIAARTGSKNASSTLAKFHLFNGDGTQPIVTNGSGANSYLKVELNSDNDSVADGANLADILLDPIKLLTENVSTHRSPRAGINNRASNWEDGGFFKKQRVYNDNTPTPYLDDTYRADNRYGPKSTYDKANKIPVGKTIGDGIPDAEESLVALDVNNGVYGLDGYWERRSIGQGLRVLVGQRLELGNTFGWKGNTEALYPPITPPNAGYDPEDGKPNNNKYRSSGDTNGDDGDKDDVFTEEIQRRSLYDNLSAVQGMVVYHHQSDKGQLPLACIASTVHPGTAETVEASRTFKNYEGILPAVLKTDFLTGEGTNGWEFDFYSSFSGKIASTAPLGIALRNLAYFAGDPQGGAPSFPPVQDTSAVHPYPYQAMWGDFSNLRRVLKSLDSGSTYAALSPADQSTLHSASCTLGLLAYNINSRQNFAGASLVNYIPSNGVANGFGKSLLDLIGAGKSGPISGTDAATGCVSAPGTTPSGESYDYNCSSLVINKEYVFDHPSLSTDEKKAAKLLGNLGQINRDRTFGFLPSNSSVYTQYVGKAGGQAKYMVPIPTECNPETNPEIDGVFNGGGGGLTDSRLAIALFCAPVKPKYPSLHYLFPTTNHSHKGTGAYAQPDTEEYIKSPRSPDYISRPSVNGNVTYKVVGDGSLANTGVGSIKLEPRALANWKLPKEDTSGSFDPESMKIFAPSGLKKVSLLDKAMFEPRENMSIRLLDFDVNLLSKTKNGTGGSADHWISDIDGIVYAFREDAVREDAIVRPKASGVNWDNCNDWAESHAPYGDVLSPSQRNCRMKVISTYPFLQDPPLNDINLISTKPVDFYADPDRRPNGFRLVNGVSLNRDGDTLSGMTFVSDNSVYVKGAFNLHKSSTAAGTCANLLEEFDKRLDDNCDGTENISNGFYNGRTGDTGSPTSARGFNYDKFAEPSFDSWRPVEIVGDAVGILSGRFRDGNIQDGFVTDRKGSRRSGEPAYGGDKSRGNGISSYMNQNRVEGDGTNFTMPGKTAWQHTKPNDVKTPVVIDRDGSIIRTDGTSYPRADLLQFVDERNKWNSRRGADVELPETTRVNAVFISGIVPSQIGQTYGGLHNFPRLLEWWQGINLYISGGFFQLNFSSAATAPYDADAWEPGSTPTSESDRISYYGAADRSWGYDVGLQYAPAGPIARRFVTIGQPRSEFYRELPVEDPYVMNLRCATYIPREKTAQQLVDPTAAANCPT